MVLFWWFSLVVLFWWFSLVVLSGGFISWFCLVVLSRGFAWWFYLVVSSQMETTIKQAEEDRNKSLDAAKRLYEEYQPLKQHVDLLRASVGLDRLSEGDEEPKLSHT